ncbi:MAG: AraC family transcriptional regulator [Cytophagales bacterium]|nr:AraC family transcriptional regulator [Cytophagales bacterium]
MNEVSFTSDLFYIQLKGDVSGEFLYGRSTYDYQEGTLLFMGPRQMATFNRGNEAVKTSGWTLLFHPDLIRKSPLGRVINNFSYFNYNINEALHVSEKERKFINTVVESLESEILQNTDKHSQGLIVNLLETILNYSNRFYDRQFYNRSNLNKDHVTRFKVFLNEHFSDQSTRKKIPTLTECGEALQMSGPYLSDLLRVETGKSAKEHIYDHLIGEAKTSLAFSTKTISEIAYDLGFEYPQHFSKLFKLKTGMTPTKYRNLN